MSGISSTPLIMFYFAGSHWKHPLGKYLLNHSFMIPGSIGVGVSTVAAYLLAKLAFGI
jgi:anaerobic C4-dicarboxylate transporter